jgi:uncharacterized protein YbcI
MGTPIDVSAGDQPGGDVLAGISNAVVQMMREAIGKGPTKCKTYLAGPDMVLVVLGGGFLESERTLYEAGHGAEVRANRQAIQDVLETRMRSVIEDRLGRRVTAFMSAQNQDPDLQIEIFMLEPAG